ncbi:MAG: hypothetical protein ABI442_04705 [Gemmatimonadaceae bacterium]
MSDSINSEYLDLVKRVVKHHPEVAEAIATVSAVTAKATFPIKSFQDLAESMGGLHATMEFRHRSFTMAELESRIPAYYFPIANENDLIAKIGDLSKRMPSLGASAAVETNGDRGINAIMMEATAPKPHDAPPFEQHEAKQRADGPRVRSAHGLSGVR